MPPQKAIKILKFSQMRTTRNPDREKNEGENKKTNKT